MKMKKTALVALLCIILSISFLSVSAAADQTVVIIGGAVESADSVQSSSGNTVVAGSNTSSVVVANSSSSSAVQTSTGASGSVIVMPNGSIISTQPSAAVTSTAQTPQTVTSVAAKTGSAASNELINEIYKLINTQRTSAGLGILGYDNALQTTADIRAKESAQSFGHTRPDGSAAVTAVTVDYNVAGENLIQVTTEYANAALLVETWMSSETHRANILLADFSQTALGIYEANGVTYISQIFTD